MGVHSLSLDIEDGQCHFRLAKVLHVNTESIPQASYTSKFQESGNANIIYLIDFTPEQIRELAASVVNKYVIGDGVSCNGGYVTRKIIKMRAYVKDPTNGANIENEYREFSNLDVFMQF